MTPGPRSGVRALVWLDLRDQLRDRKAMLGRLAPTVFISIGVAFTLLVSGGRDSNEIDLGRAAVSGAVQGSETFLADLAEAGFEVEEVADAEHTVAATDTPVGIVLHGPADALLAAGEPVDGSVVARGDGQARNALLALRAALVDIDDAHNREPAAFETVVERIDASASRLRDDLARLVPGLLLLLGSSATATLAGQLADKRRDGVLAAQLVLPLDRRGFVVGKALTEVVLTVVAQAVPMLLCAVGLAAIVSVAGGGAVQVVGTVVLVVLTVVVGTIGFAMAGAAVALRWPDRAVGSEVSVGPMMVSLLALFLNALIENDVPSALAAVPVLSLSFATRLAADGTLDVGFLAGALASTGVAGVLALRAIAEFGTDRLAARP